MPTLNWIGKDKVINHHLDVPYRTLEEQYRYGDPKAAGENKIIHGDNWGKAVPPGHSPPDGTEVSVIHRRK